MDQAVTLVSAPGSSTTGMKTRLGKITLLDGKVITGKVIWINSEEK